MPELPEVETTCRGIAPLISGCTIEKLDIHQYQLRQSVPENLPERCQGLAINGVSRRAKYIILELNNGNILIHLGMTGNLRVLPELTPPTKHDHIDLTFTDGQTLRYHDPRRFGSWQWADLDISTHPSISHLGPEPLSHTFNGQYLQKRCRGKKQAIKSAIMDNQIVVGVGNIYATESLFLSRIHPLMPAGKLTHEQYELLAQHIKQVLQNAIIAGGTTLKDFISPEGKPGYFSQSLLVYGRKNSPCLICDSTIQSITIGGRSTAYCPNCQLG